MPDPNEMAAGIAANLEPNGVAILEFPSVEAMLRTGAFDTIYHEHYSYWSLQAAEELFRRHGLHIEQADTLSVHGGSYRIFVRHGVSEPRHRGINGSLYAEFEQFAQNVRASLDNVIRNALLGGKKIAAYGAAAKGNTLLNFCQLTRREITCIADTTPWKQGKVAPGSHIPVVTLEEMLAENPDYVLLLAWNWRDVILPQLKGYKVIVPIPEVEVIEP